MPARLRFGPAPQVKLLGGADASALTHWAQDNYAAALAGTQPPLLAGLRVSEQPDYPLPQVRRRAGRPGRLPERLPARCRRPPTRSRPAARRPQALCAQLLREMDPGAGIEDAYKRVTEDPVYRWRVGRAVAAAGA